jgi:hypothetical protein
MGLCIAKARYSAKTENWILNEGDSGWSILLLIWLGQGLHFLFGRRAILEIIWID